MSERIRNLAPLHSLVYDASIVVVSVDPAAMTFGDFTPVDIDSLNDIYGFEDWQIVTEIQASVPVGRELYVGVVIGQGITTVGTYTTATPNALRWARNVVTAAEVRAAGFGPGTRGIIGTGGARNVGANITMLRTRIYVMPLDSAIASKIGVLS